MPRRRSRKRGQWTNRFDFEAATHTQRMRYLRRLTRDHPGLTFHVDRYDADPDAYPDIAAGLEYATSRRAVEDAKARLIASSAAARAERDKTRQSPHDGHGPPNIRKQTDPLPGSAPSQGNGGEEPPRPRVLFL